MTKIPRGAVGETVLVEWVDAMGMSSWKERSELDLHIGKCKTVGQVLSIDREKISVAQNQCETNDTVDHVMTIPHGCITAVTVLLPAKSRKHHRSK